MTKRKVTQKEKANLINATERAIQELNESGEKIDFQAVARKLGVARSTLYRNQTVYSLIANARNNQFLVSDPINHFQREIEGIKGRLDVLEEKVALILEEEKMTPRINYSKEEEKSED